jgi:hypothetical protein
LVGSLVLLCRYKIFFPAFALLDGTVSSLYTISFHLSPKPSKLAGNRAGSPVSVYVSLVFLFSVKYFLPSQFFIHLPCAGMLKQSMGTANRVGTRNRVVVPARQATQPGGIISSESIP